MSLPYTLLESPHLYPAGSKMRRMHLKEEMTLSVCNICQSLHSETNERQFTAHLHAHSCSF